jgi:hypothetical protein
MESLANMSEKFLDNFPEYVTYPERKRLVDADKVRLGAAFRFYLFCDTLPAILYRKLFDPHTHRTQPHATTPLGAPLSLGLQRGPGGAFPRFHGAGREGGSLLQRRVAGGGGGGPAGGQLGLGAGVLAADGWHVAFKVKIRFFPLRLVSLICDCLSPHPVHLTHHTASRLSSSSWRRQRRPRSRRPSEWTTVWGNACSLLPRPLRLAWRVCRACRPTRCRAFSSRLRPARRSWTCRRGSR